MPTARDADRPLPQCVRPFRLIRFFSLTSLIGIVTSLVRKTSGTVRVFGHDLDHELNAVKSAIGVVPQEIALYPTLSARENLRFWARMYDVPGAVAARRVEDVLAVVHDNQ